MFQNCVVLVDLKITIIRLLFNGYSHLILYQTKNGLPLNMPIRRNGNTTELFYSRNYSTYTKNGLIKRKRKQLSFDIVFSIQKRKQLSFDIWSPERKSKQLSFDIWLPNGKVGQLLYDIWFPEQKGGNYYMIFGCQNEKGRNII